MTFETHRQFAVFWALVGAMVLYIDQITEVNYYLVLFMIVPFAKLGAEFPDFDHSWCNIKEKTVFSWLISNTIHFTGGTHRSWQTHSIDIAAAMTLIACNLPGELYKKQYITAVNREILSIVLLGISLGWLSHLFSDMLTSGKVKLLCFANFKIGLVPTKFLWIRFNTGNEWEQFVYTITRIINILVGAVALAFPLIYSRI